MVQPSSELAEIVRRFIAAVLSKDGPTLTNILSRSEYLRYQGTADNESWSGQVFRDGFPSHTAELPDFVWEEVSLEAFSNGGTGWAYLLAMLTNTETGMKMLYRFTYVFCLEDGAWRIVQNHVSNAVSNIEKGIEHSALDKLLAAVREDFRVDQREGTASVMFTDIANSSALAELLGDRVWVPAVQQHFETVRSVIERNAGQVVKSLGDGTMSIFPSAGSALQAAVELQRANASAESEPHLGLRVGLHSGDVIQTENDFFGTVVNKAARIADAAASNEIRLSDVTLLLAGPGWEAKASPNERGALKGLSGDHLTYNLAWE